MNKIDKSSVVEGLMNYETLDNFLQENDMDTLQKALIDVIIDLNIKAKCPSNYPDFEELTKKNQHIIADLANLYRGLSDSFTHIPEDNAPSKKAKKQ